MEELAFADVGEAAGVGAVDQDSTGVCYGDLDNDGDHDLVVVSHNAPTLLFENRGDGTFADVSARSGLADGEVRASSGCSLGDVDGDGLLDLTVANTYDNWDHSLGLNVERFALNQHIVAAGRSGLLGGGGGGVLGASLRACARQSPRLRDHGLGVAARARAYARTRPGRSMC